MCPTTIAVQGEGWNYDINSSLPRCFPGRALRLDSHLPYSGPLHKMTLKGFYLVGQDKDVYHQDIPIDQCHDFESLQIAIAEQYNIIQATGKHIFQNFSCSPVHRLTCHFSGIALQDAKGNDLPDLDAVLDCEEDLGITVDGQAIRDPAGPEGLPFVGSYYEVFPDHLVSRLLSMPIAQLTLPRETTLACSRSMDQSSNTTQWAK